MSSALSQINAPDCLIQCNEPSCCNSHHHAIIEEYYNNIITIASNVVSTSVPTVSTPAGKQRIPGWTDYVQEKYNLAKDAFLNWVYVGKPKSGFEHLRMCKTRAAF